MHTELVMIGLLLWGHAKHTYIYIDTEKNVPYEK